MKINLLQALKLKSLLKKEIDNFTLNVSFGNLQKNDIDIISTNPSITEALSKLNKILALDKEISNKIASVNYELGIQELIKDKTHLTKYNQLLSMYLSRFPLEKGLSVENGVSIKWSLKDIYMSKKDIKKLQKANHIRIFEIDSEIDKLNASLIDVSFSHEDICDIISNDIF